MTADQHRIAELEVEHAAMVLLLAQKDRNIAGLRETVAELQLAILGRTTDTSTDEGSAYLRRLTERLQQAS